MGRAKKKAAAKAKAIPVPTEAEVVHQSILDRGVVVQPKEPTVNLTEGYKGKCILNPEGADRHGV